MTAVRTFLPSHKPIANGWFPQFLGQRRWLKWQEGFFRRPNQIDLYFRRPMSVSMTLLDCRRRILSEERFLFFQKNNIFL